MPGSEYATGGGGKLKLKGSKVSDGRVDKKKKKAKKREEGKRKEELEQEEKEEKAKGSGNEESKDDGQGQGRPDEGTGAEQEQEDGGVVVGKTEAERKYEDAKKKRVCLFVLFLS